MTDQPMPPAIDDSEAEEPSPPPEPRPAAPTVPSRRRTLLVVGMLIAFVLVVIFTLQDNGVTNDLKIGDCFDLPSSTTANAVTHRACTESHTAEVFALVTYSGTDKTRPVASTLDAFVTASCDPVFATYVGKALQDLPNLAVGYFYPSADGWQSGQRLITCYVAKADQTAISASLKGSAGP